MKIEMKIKRWVAALQILRNCAFKCGLTAEDVWSVCEGVIEAQITG